MAAGAGVLLLSGAALAQQATQEQQPGQAGQEMMQQQPGQTGQGTGAMGAASDFGEDGVRRLQEALNQAGHDVGEVDGQWGPQTQSALRDFQEQQGLEASGEPDEETLTALGLSMDELTSGTGTAGTEMPTGQTPTGGGLGAEGEETTGQEGMQQPGGATQQ